MPDIDITERTNLSLHMELKDRSPWEIMNVIFDYFATALHGAPKEKVDEFFIHFENGIRDQLINNKETKKVP